MSDDAVARHEAQVESAVVEMELTDVWAYLASQEDTASVRLMRNVIGAIAVGMSESRAERLAGIPNCTP